MHGFCAHSSPRWLEAPAFVFLCEMTIEGKRVVDLRAHLGFAGCMAVSSDVLSCGLALFLSHEVDVTLHNVSD